MLDGVPSHAMHESGQRRSNTPTEALLAESSWVRRLAARLVGDPHLADDLSQEALAVALRRGPLPNGELRPWLGGVVRNLARMQWRSQGRRARSEERAARPEELPSSAEDAVRRAELQRAVVDAVLALEEPYRSTVLLRFLEERSVEDVARELGVSPSTVRVRCMRGLEKLELRLTRELGGDRRDTLAALAFLARDPSLVPAAAGGAATLSLTGWMVMNTYVKLVLVGLLVLLPFGLFLAQGQSPPTSEPGSAGPVAAALEELPGAAVLAGRDSGVRESLEPVHESRDAGLAPATSARDASVAPVVGDALEGFVRSNGSGIAGARVRAFQIGSGENGALEIEPIAEGTADADGSFALDGLVPFEEHVLLVTAEGFASATQRARTGFPAEIELDPACTLFGRVFVNELPLAGATLVTRREGYAAGVLARSVSVETDETGAYSIPELAGGSAITVEVRAPGRVPYHSSLELSAVGPTRHDIHLDEGVVVEGRVFDPRTGESVAHAGLFAARDSDPFARCDSSGRFSLRLGSKLHAFARGELPDADPYVDLGLGWGAGMFGVHAEGYCWSSVPVRALSALKEGEELELPLLAAGRIEGVVRDEAGAPLAGVSITHQSFRSEQDVNVSGAPGSRRTKTDGEGRFVLPAVVPGEHAMFDELTARLGSMKVTRKGVAPPEPGGVRTLELVLARGFALTGRLRVNGEDAPGYVYVQSTADEDLARNVETDAEGRFAFVALPAGDYEVKACTADGLATWSEPREVRLVEPRLEPLLLDILSVHATISGRLVDEAGAPIVGQDVLCFRALGGRVPRGMGRAISGMDATDEQGWFEIPIRAEEGELFDVTVFWGNSSVIEPDVESGRDDVRLVVPELVAVELVVRSAATGERVSKVAVAWRRPGDERFVRLYSGQEIPTTSESVLSIELPIGAVDLRVSAESSGFAERLLEGVQVGEGAEPRVRCELDPAPAPAEDGPGEPQDGLDPLEGLEPILGGDGF